MFNKIKNALSSKATKMGAAVTGEMVATSAKVHAALPAAATSALSDVSTGITDAVDGAWPLIGAALAAGIVIKLVKRFTNKV